MWIALKAKPNAWAKLLDLRHGGSIVLCLTSQNVAEMLDPKRVSRQDLAENTKFLEPIEMSEEPDALFILGLSRLSQAELSTSDSARVFEDHVAGKLKSTNHARDGIHLVNSMIADSTLVTCDSQLRKSAVRESLIVQCISLFFRELALGQIDECRSCRVEAAQSRPRLPEISRLTKRRD